MSDEHDIERANTALTDDVPAGGQGASRVRVVPALVISALTSMVLLLVAFSFLAIFAPAGLDVLADPLSPPLDPKPSWYFLFHYRYLRAAPPVIGALTPIVLVTLLAIWPFIDRNPSRRARDRVLALGLCAAVVVIVSVLTYLGWRS